MQKIIVKKENSGIRLDKFLVSTFSKASADKQEFFSPRKIALQSRGKYSRGEIIRNINEGSILVNGEKIKPSYAIKTNDIVRINFKTALEKLVSNKEVDFEIIYSDENFIIINKPTGLKVHPNSFAEVNTLANGLIAKFPEIESINDGSKDSKLRPGIVHRLDQETSGIMVIARNQKSFIDLKKLFQTRKISKKYIALVLGKFKEKKGIIEKSLARAGTYRKQSIAVRKTQTKIRPAITEYEVIKEFPNFSLVEAKPKTGRTHQIRIHLFSLGNPVAGDKLYKLKKIPKIGLPKRQLLHAKKLEFELFGKKYAFSADLPKDFENFLENLK